MVFALLHLRDGRKDGATTLSPPRPETVRVLENVLTFRSLLAAVHEGDAVTLSTVDVWN